MTQRIILIGCGSAKLSTPAPAQFMYTSNLFRIRQKYAIRESLAHGIPWGIVTAHRYGLFLPNQSIDPYDARMQEVLSDPDTAAAWCDAFLGSATLAWASILRNGAAFEVHAGASYAKAVKDAIATHREHNQADEENWAHFSKCIHATKGVDLYKLPAWYRERDPEEAEEQRILPMQRALYTYILESARYIGDEPTAQRMKAQLETMSPEPEEVPTVSRETVEAPEEPPLPGMTPGVRCASCDNDITVGPDQLPECHVFADGVVFCPPCFREHQAKLEASAPTPPHVPEERHSCDVCGITVAESFLHDLEGHRVCIACMYAATNEASENDVCQACGREKPCTDGRCEDCAEFIQPVSRETPEEPEANTTEAEAEPEASPAGFVARVSFDAKVTHNDRHPILMGLDRARKKNPQVPSKDHSVWLLGPDGTPETGQKWIFGFRKIAVNTARPIRVRSQNPNHLPSLLRDWFGPDAGETGSRHFVRFEPNGNGKGWVCWPVEGAEFCKCGACFSAKKPKSSGSDKLKRLYRHGLCQFTGTPVAPASEGFKVGDVVYFLSGAGANPHSSIQPKRKLKFFPIPSDGDFCSIGTISSEPFIKADKHRAFLITCGEDTYSVVETDISRERPEEPSPTPEPTQPTTQQNLEWTEPKEPDSIVGMAPPTEKCEDCGSLAWRLTDGMCEDCRILIAKDVPPGQYNTENRKHTVTIHAKSEVDERWGSPHKRWSVPYSTDDPRMGKPTFGWLPNDYKLKRLLNQI